MQILQPETTCQRNFRHISFYTDGQNSLVNISDAMKNHDCGHKSLSTVIEKLLGTNSYDFVVDEKFPHWFIKFATVGKNNANKLVTYLNRNCATVENKEYHYSAINGDFTKAKESQDYCKKVIADNPGKICVFISQGMATTSFSVTGIGNSVVFTDNEITADDSQALHRSATWADGKDECNMIVVTTNDSMEHSFDDIFEDETKIATTREEKVEIYKELLSNNSMVHYTVNGSSVLPVKITNQNADKFLDKKAKAMTRVASIMTAIRDLDEETIDNILETIAPAKGTSTRAGSKKPDSFDPFGEEDPDNNTPTSKQKKSVTPAKKEKILRAFVESAVTIPAIAREQGTTIAKFGFWGETNIPEELFFEVYNSSWIFKDRIDSIYNLCDDENYLIENYIHKLTI